MHLLAHVMLVTQPALLLFVVQAQEGPQGQQCKEVVVWALYVVWVDSRVERRSEGYSKALGV